MELQMNLVLLIDKVQNKFSPIILKMTRDFLFYRGKLSIDFALDWLTLNYGKNFDLTLLMIINVSISIPLWMQSILRLIGLNLYFKLWWSSKKFKETDIYALWNLRIITTNFLVIHFFYLAKLFFISEEWVFKVIWSLVCFLINSICNEKIRYVSFLKLGL